MSERIATEDLIAQAREWAEAHPTPITAELLHKLADRLAEVAPLLAVLEAVEILSVQNLSGDFCWAEGRIDGEWREVTKDTPLAAIAALGEAMET